MDIFVKAIADWTVFLVITIGAYALLFKVPKGSRIKSYSRVLIAGLTAYLLAKLAGALYQPSAERPFELLGVSPGAAYLDNPGFPSDHVLFVTAITLAVWFETRDKFITLILAALTLFISVGRILALVHSPIDVIFGIIIASVGALWYLNGKDHKDRRAPHGKTTT